MELDTSAAQLVWEFNVKSESETVIWSHSSHFATKNWIKKILYKKISVLYAILQCTVKSEGLLSFGHTTATLSLSKPSIESIIVTLDFGTIVCTKLKVINKSKSNIRRFICIVNKHVSASALIVSDTVCVKN